MGYRIHVHIILSGVCEVEGKHSGHVPTESGIAAVRNERGHGPDGDLDLCRTRRDGLHGRWIGSTDYVCRSILFMIGCDEDDGKVRGFIYLFTYLLSQLITYWFTYSLNHLFTCPLAYSLTHLLNHSLSHLFTYSLTCLLTHSLTRLFIT